MRDEDPRVRVAAANSLLDRGWGKPVATVEAEPAHGDVTMSVNELAREAVYALTLVSMRQAADVYG